MGDDDHGAWEGPWRYSVSSPLAWYRARSALIRDSIRRVLDGGRYLLGDELRSFEIAFSKYVGTEFGVGVGSGTDALYVALLASGVGRGDRVLTVGLTAPGTLAAIHLSGASPVLVDVDALRLTMDPIQLDATINHLARRGSKPKAIIPVHLYGQAARVNEISGIAEQHGMTLIEDCAQAHGATMLGRKVGTFGRCGCFSFYPTKNLATCGDGGIIVTDDVELRSRARALRNYGADNADTFLAGGKASRLDEVHAAILRVNLEFLDEDNHHRRSLARVYDECISPLELPLPHANATNSHVFYQYVIRTKARAQLSRYLNEHGVETQVHYPVPAHLDPRWSGTVEVGPGGLPHTERASNEVLSLPLHLGLQESDIRTIGGLVADWHKCYGFPPEPKRGG